MSSLAELASSGALSETGLTLGSVTRDEYVSLGRMLGRVQESLRWAIGDYILAGEELFGEDAYQLSESLGISVESRQQYVRVSQAIEHPRRRGELTWSHHRAVAHIDDPDRQDQWLEDAVEGTWTSGDLWTRVHESPDDDDPPYTDRDMLNQISSEIRTARDLYEFEPVALTLLSGLERKIELHVSGKKWWMEMVEA